MEKQEIIQLVIEAQSGDSAAISTLYENYRNEVYSIALRVTKDRALSDDIVQETFVEMILKINDLKNPASFPAWLKIMAHHQCTRYYKKKETVHEAAAIENDEGWSVFDAVEETNASFIPDEALDQKEFKATILEMIDDLPDAQRAALHMFYFEEMPLKVIAKIQGVSVNTANTRLNRGRLAMKDSIEKYEKKHGVRLHSIAFFPFFKWLLKGSEESMSAKSAARVAQQISAKTGVSISASGTAIAAETTSATVSSVSTTVASSAGAAGIKAAATSIISKVIAGVVAVSVAVGGSTVYLQSQNKTHLPKDSESEITKAASSNNMTEPVILDDKTIDDSNVVDLAYIRYEEMLQTGKTPSGMIIRYYTYLDVDQNGIPDLIAADANGTPESWTTCELYTLGDDNVIYCGTTDSNYDYLYHVNNKYIRGNNRMGAQYISIAESIFTTVYHWNDSGDRNDPAISINNGSWEYITQDEFDYYNDETGGFVTTSNRIILQDNNSRQVLGLENVLDFSKTWSHIQNWENNTFCTSYVFEEDGSFYCNVGWFMSDLITAYAGTYTYTNDILTLSYNNDNESFVCDYKLDPETLILEQLSIKGIGSFQNQGDRFQLYVEDLANTPNKVKEQVGYYYTKYSSSESNPELLNYIQLPDSFIFTSGAGGWATELSIANDGTFSGQYHDSEMGAVGEGYPNGMVYYCNFYGYFSDISKISEHVYHVSLDYLEIEDTPGTTHIEEGILYEAADAYGLAGASDIYIYTPGTPIKDIPAACLIWMIGRADGEFLEDIFVLYNVHGEYAFISE